MNIFYTLLGILILYVIFQAAYSGYYLHVGREISKQKFITKISLVDDKKPPFKLFISGDSVAVGVGASSFENSLSGRIDEYLSQKYNVVFENQAVSGARMNDLLKFPVPKEKQDLIVLVISSNDLFNFTNKIEFEKSTKQVLDLYLKYTDKLIIEGPGRVFDGTAIPYPIRLIYRYEAPKYSQIIDSAINKNPKIVHIDPTVSAIDHKKYGPTEAVDHFHPNDQGYKFWFDLISPAL